MKRRMIAMLMCSVMLLLCGCDSGPQKYKRISFERQVLGDSIKSIDQNAAVINNAKESFPTQVPVYEIKTRVISDQECQQMMDNLGMPSNPYDFEHSGNSLYINLAGMLSTTRGYFDMTQEELETLAWEVFRKIPFIEGEYEYYGIRGENTISDSDGEHITRVLVSFYPILDGARVTGDNRCDMWFDGSGLVAIRISLFDFEKTGEMNMISLADAEPRIKTPDDLSIDDAVKEVDILQVKRVKLLLINQYSRGCTILQPVYNFIGTATSKNGEQGEFKSKVIAIPEEMTYEEE